MWSHARVVVQMLRGSLILAVVLSPSFDCAKMFPPEQERRHPSLIPRKGVGTLGVLRCGGIAPQLRGGGERAVFRKPVPAGLAESSLDEAVRRYYEDTPMAPTNNLLSLLRTEGRCDSLVIFNYAKWRLAGKGMRQGKNTSCRCKRTRRRRKVASQALQSALPRGPCSRLEGESCDESTLMQAQRVHIMVAKIHSGIPTL